MLKHFLCSESGAVTVDWVVMAASVVGLGASSVAVVRVGQSALAADINNALSSASVAAMGIAKTRRFFTFEDGDLGGWTGARLTNHPVLGAFLGPYAGSEGPAPIRSCCPRVPPAPQSALT